ncbi:MAG: M20/M25/M40 family metallo-hydrolase [Chloroflexi bacterium]|nr:M20/M25/M40 family metallo-hydrolase [Chloroflexota bacterium]
MAATINRLLDLAIQIQQVPAPTFHEGQRAEFVRGLFIKENLQDVSMDALNNVFARLPGKREGLPLIVSAHMDTVFPENTGLHVTREESRIYGPGIGDNSLGVAALFGLLWNLRARRIELPFDIWFAASACEEGLGDLRGIKAVVERFGAGVKAYLVLEGMALGHVYHRAIGVRRYRVTVRTAGGHSWSDYGQPSAVHEAARLVTRITSLALPAHPRTTLNVGLIKGGTGVNVLAADAAFDLDMRSESTDELNMLIGQVEKIIRSANGRYVKIEMEVIGSRPAGEIAAHHPLVQLAQECLGEQGLNATLTSGSTDANIPLSRGYPALVLGITTGGSAHTVHEYIDVEPVGRGMECLTEFVVKISDQNGAGGK